MREPLPESVALLAARLRPRGWEVRTERTPRGGFRYVAEFRGEPPCAVSAELLAHDRTLFARRLAETSPELFARLLEVSAERLEWHAHGCQGCWDAVQAARRASG